MLLSLFLAAAAPAQEPAPRPSERLERALSGLRAERRDLDVRPGRWDTRFTLPDIEQLLSDPVGLPDRSGQWREGLAAARGAGGLAAFAGALLQLPTEPPRPGAAAAAQDALPEALAGLSGAAAKARPFLEQAMGSLAPEARRRLTDGFLRQLVHGPPERLEPELFELAARFDRAALLQALRHVAEAADRAAEGLLQAKPGRDAVAREQRIDGVTAIVGGPGDDAFSADELARAAIVIDLGGTNRYQGAPAAAGPGEIKVVLDLGTPVVESTGSVASGNFGIGLLLAPRAGPGARVRGGPFSLGAGLFGAGLLLVKGDRASLESGDFSQGAAAFGLGALDVDGELPVATATVSGQGFAYTAGVGLFRARGRGARLACGLVYPDPRDAVAALSLCQGVGYGPRAFAAGGFGLALVESDGAEVDGNYFAQGAGYWHGFGGFYFRGDRARIQSRRYGQGAGIHTALGAFEVAGNANRVLHWGVGPGFGWDWGTGWAAVRGDENRLYADWASGRGDVNGHGFLSVEGRGNLLRLGDAGTGALKRSAPSYGVVLLSGAANRFWAQRLSSAAPLGIAFQPSLWGAVEAEGEATLEPSLAVDGPSFRNMDREREEAGRADREWNAARLKDADALAPRARVPRWLFLSAEGGLDGRTPGEALTRLVSLPETEAALLPGLLSPERFDEFLFLRTVAAGYGRALAPSLSKAIASAGGLRKALLLSLLRSVPAQAAIPAALAAWRDRDWRVRRESIGVLGSLLDRELGEEPGRLAFLQEWLAVCRRPDAAAPLAPEAIERIGHKRLSDLFAALALDPKSGAGDRLELLTKVPDVFNPVNADGLNAFAAIWGRRPEDCRRALERELKESGAAEAKARERVLEAAKDPSPDLLPVALTALGQLGRAKDAAVIRAGLVHDSAIVREAAAMALGRLGKAGGDAIRAELSSSTAAVRALAVIAAAQSSDPDVFRLLARGFSDPDDSVRRAAIAAPFAAQVPTTRLRKEFVAELERLASSDSSLEIRNAAAHAAAAFR